jgi:thioesterase domain-containing protein
MEEAQATGDAEPDEAAAPASLLVDLQPGGPGPALFCVGVFHFRALARHFGTDRPVVGLLGQDLDADAEYLAQVEKLAARNVEEVRRAQREGPYHLLGYCFGGLVAYEMASQMRADGDEVAFLALIDTVNPQAVAEAAQPTSKRDRLRTRLEQVQTEGVGYLGTWGRKRARYEWVRTKMALKKMAASVYQRLEVPSPSWLEGTASYEAEAAAAARYHPRPYDGPLTLVTCSPVAPKNAAAWGWGSVVTGALEVVNVQSERHMDVLEEPRVRELAEALRGCLEGVAMPTVTRVERSVPA